MKRKNEIILAGDCKMKRKAAVVCCSDGRKTPEREKLELTVKHLEEMGISVCLSDHLFSEKPSCETLRPKERAAELMRFFSDSAITDIFDISGGDLANGILPYLDYNAISESGACFYGYSDLTTLINAIYAKTGKSSVLYQVKNIAGDNADIQKKRLSEYLCGQSKELTDFRYEFVNGTEMSGVLVGGNIRCFLKLAGTEYMPAPSGKILLLEAFGSTLPQVYSCISQLNQLGCFEKCRGILLGTFTKLCSEELYAEVISQVISETGGKKPVAITREIGHGSDSRAAIIGKTVSLSVDITVQSII